MDWVAGNQHHPDSTVAAEPPGPISQADLDRLALAAGRWRKVRGAARLAAFNAVSLGMIGGLALLAGVAQVLAALTTGRGGGGIVGLVLGAVLLAMAGVEHRGRLRLLRLDPAGGRILGWNQVALLAVIVLWCGGKLYAAAAGPNPYEGVIRQNPELAGMLRPIIEAYATLSVVTYVSVIAVSAVFQGFCARRYFAAARHGAATLAATEPWIVRVLRVAA